MAEGNVYANVGSVTGNKGFRPDTTPQVRSGVGGQRSKVKGQRSGVRGFHPDTAPRVRSEVKGKRSGVRGEKVCLVVVSVLLLVTLSALIGTIVYYNSPSKVQTDAVDKTTTISGTTEAVKTTAGPAPTCPNTAPSCGEGWELFGTKCYYFSPNTPIFPWAESKMMCQWLKGRLVKIENTEEQNFLDGKIRSLMTDDGDRFWIGLTDSETEGQWKWTDGSPLNPSLAFWTRNEHNREPDDWKKEDPEGEDCVIMGENFYINNLKSWYDISCKIRKQRSICERNLPQNN